MSKAFSGTNRVAMTSSPRLVDSSFQWCSVYSPDANRAAVMLAKIKNGE